MSSPAGHLLLFGLLPARPASALPASAPTDETSGHHLLRAPGELAFPLHTEAVRKWFAGSTAERGVRPGGAAWRGGGGVARRGSAGGEGGSGGRLRPPHPHRQPRLRHPVVRHPLHHHPPVHEARLVPLDLGRLPAVPRVPYDEPPPVCPAAGAHTSRTGSPPRPAPGAPRPPGPGPAPATAARRAAPARGPRTPGPSPCRTSVRAAAALPAGRRRAPGPAPRAASRRAGTRPRSPAAPGPPASPTTPDGRTARPSSGRAAPGS